MSSDWLDDARAAPFPQVASSLGMAMRAKRWGPCPACGATSTRNDKRPPIGRVNCKGWICNACKAGGDVLDLVSFQVNGVKASKAGRDFKKIGLFFRNGEPDAGGFERREVPEPTVKRLDSQEIAAVLHASKRAASSRRDDVRRFIMKRKYSNPPAWVLPNGWSAPWWPWRDFPLVVPAFNGNGALLGIHGRAVGPAPKRKTTWPKGVDCRGLVFADPQMGVPMLRVKRKAPRALIVEGMTDYLWAAESQAGRCAVFGIASGSASALQLVDFRGVEVFVGVDDDKAGRRYAKVVAESIAPTPCRMLPLRLARPKM
jgi:hypothetical protein